MTSTARWHLNEKGDPKPCSASLRACPYGDAERHYASVEDARMAYEVTMVEESMPGLDRLDEAGRRTLALPGALAPARTHVAPSPRPAEASNAALHAAKMKLRSEIRPGFERTVGLDTYSINIHNERGHEPGTLHIVECDTPGALQRERFDGYLSANGFTAVERGRRTSIFAPVLKGSDQ